MLATSLAAVGVLIAAATGAAAAPAPTVDRVTKGFQPVSTSWTTSNAGWVLGFEPCGTNNCAALYATSNAGQTWARKVAPPIKVAEDQAQVRMAFGGKKGHRTGLITNGRVVFASYDGAMTWRRERLGGSSADARIGSITATSTDMYALVGAGSGDAGKAWLVRSPLGVRQWAKVRGISGSIANQGMVGGNARADGSSVAVSIGNLYKPKQLWTTADGKTWSKQKTPCVDEASADVAPVGAKKTFVLCSSDPGFSKQTKQLMVSTDGKDFTEAGEAPREGYTAGVAAGSDQTFAVGATWGDGCFVHSSFDGGATWSTTLAVADHGNVNDLDFTDATHGTVVCGWYGAGDMAIYRTSDAGHTWQKLAL